MWGDSKNIAAWGRLNRGIERVFFSLLLRGIFGPLHNVDNFIATESESRYTVNGFSIKVIRWI